MATNKFASWVMTYNCNSKPHCSYCMQGNNKKDNPEIVSVKRIANAIASLPGEWWIGLLGGEVFALPFFVDTILPILLESNHSYSLTTNFLVSLNEIEKIVDIKNHSQLKEIKISYHKQLWKDPIAFLDKIKMCLNILANSGISIKIALPLYSEALLEIKNIIVPCLKNLKVEYFFQILKLPNKDGSQRIFKYSNDDSEILNSLIGNFQDGKEAVKNESYTGKECSAGVQLITILDDGSVYRCFDFAQVHEMKGYLGNIAQEGFVLPENTIPCPFRFCSCGVAAYRGLIKGNE